MTKIPKTTKTASSSMESPRALSRDNGHLVRKTAAEMIEAILRKRILLCELAPGSALKQEELAEELGVSRIPLREAIRTLSSEGLIELIPHKGANVSMVSSQQVQELYDLRLRLEPWLFEMATAQHHDKDLSPIEAILANMDEADDQLWSELNWEFHKSLYRAAQHTTAFNIVSALNEKTKRYLCLQVLNLPIREQAYREHRELLELYRNHQSAKAKLAMEQHISEASKQVLAIVTSMHP